MKTISNTVTIGRLFSLSRRERAGVGESLSAGYVLPFHAILLAIFISWLIQPALAQSGDANSVPDKKIVIVLVGDSTVNDRTGWGLGFKQFLDTNKIECINVAAGGRSSMSFMREGRWTNALALKGDYYLIQFGHNNEPGKPGRSTDMPTFVRNMEQYVDDARAIGAQPVLVTPLTRRQWDPANPGKIKSSLEPYAADVRKIAAEKNVPLIDLHARSLELYEQLGREKCYEFSPAKLVDGKTAYDGTHLIGPGRVMFARLVVEELRKAVPELSPVLLTESRDPMPTLPEDKYDAIVANDVSANYTNLQLAIDAAPDDGTRPYRILLKPGTYEGQFIVPKSKNHIELLGQDLDSTILTYDLNVRETNASTNLRFKGTGVIVLGDDFHAQNLTIQNTSGDHGQALALRVDGDRAVFNHCHILGWQDTMMVNNGRDYFTDCYIAGRVDFVYGSATAVFQDCEIHSKDGGHVTAANTPQDKPFGMVFMNCKLTGDSTPWADPASNPARTNVTAMADLGRPWRPWASVTYLNCWMGSHIKPEGWNNWRNPSNELTARYAEYNSTGPGANPDSRVKWSKQLISDEADKISVSSVLGGDDGWNPTGQADPVH
ncbi:MAG TPA: pectinesterase family protein [Candidatus Acidoferrales bacterium]|jgi:pectinesterase|nr:pectinesterase family protein [Candidatus Acidoferrales bacterium]